MNALKGITRPGHTDITNPGQHSPVSIQNRVQIEQYGPDGVLKKRIDHRGNILTTYGLNRMAEMFASDASGASALANAVAIGTDTTAAASTQSGLGASTQLASGASFVRSDAGARTLAFNGTFASNGNACAVHEVGIFETNNAAASMLARSVLGTDSINRGTGDEIRTTYSFIFGTA